MSQSLRIFGKTPRPDRFAFAASCALSWLCVASPSHAEETSAQAENISAARTLGLEGVALADAGKCPDAIDRLQRAEELHHAPTILGRLGECQVAVGEIVLGTENLNSVVREPLAANAPKVFHDAQERAQKVLASATPKIAQLLIHVFPADVNATVTVAGKPVSAALIGAERPTDPGTHEVTASARGYLPASASVTLAPGAHQEVTLTLVSDPSAVVAPSSVGTPAGAGSIDVASGAPAIGATDAPRVAPQKNNTPAYVALAVGGAGVLVGSVTGVLALSKASDCPNKVCPTQGALDDAKGVATISTVSFGVGIAGLALGTILLIVGNKGEPVAAPTAAQYEPKLSLKPWVGLNGAGLMGSF
jgi:hypothetical protein